MRLLIFLFLLAGCGTTEGDFGWAVTKAGLDRIEKKLYAVTDYKMMREDLIFSPNDTVHLVYRFHTPPMNGKDFYLALYKNSLSYVEQDLKRIRYDEDSKSLKATFDNLEAGNYLVKVATDEGEMFDSVTFDIIPEDEYFTEDEFDQSEEDEIIRYSKNQ